MSPLARMRRAPWIGGALLVALAVGLTAPVAYAVGVRRWPFVVGLAAVLILLFGGLERLWQRRPLPSPRRAASRLRFRVVPGGKGNGWSHDNDKTDDDDQRPRWLM